LGVSSLDLGRLFIQAALFSWAFSSSRFLCGVIPGREANPESRDSGFARFACAPE
jgi:hypothetical protein